MATGFGKTQPQPKASQRSKQRAVAAEKMDKMRADGLPEYEVYLRIQDKQQWYPVGVVAVQRSSQINRAIYDSQADLLQGAFRIYPVLRKHSDRLEYGYRLKAYKDEPIQVAVPPKASPTGGLQAIGNSLRASVGALFNRG